jgi:hypothetical protein
MEPHAGGPFGPKRLDRLPHRDIGVAASGNLKPLFVSVNFDIDPNRG